MKLYEVKKLPKEVKLLLDPKTKKYKMKKVNEAKREKVVDELKSRKKEKHNKEAKMKQPPQSAGIESISDTDMNDPVMQMTQ